MIKTIIGLGNPGQKYFYTRHNIGFRVLDAFGELYAAQWRTKDTMELAEIVVGDVKLLLVKPQTFMNNSGAIMPFLTKQGIKPEEVLVVHDELELPFGVVKFKMGGSAKGHNGLKSLIAACGEHFGRLRFGIDRPAIREEVPDYVLAKFKEPSDAVEQGIAEAVRHLQNLIEG